MICRFLTGVLKIPASQAFDYETDLSTKQDQAQAPPRVPSSHAHQGRTIGIKGAPGKRSESPVSLNKGIMLFGSGRFCKSQRLIRPEEFQAVFTSSRRSRDDVVLVLIRKNTLGLARLGMAVSMKHAQNAVERNRIKRIIRESFRCNQNNLKGLDIVVVSYKPIAGKSNRELRTSLDKHFRETGH